MRNYLTRKEYIKKHKFTNNSKVYSFYDSKTKSIVYVDKKTNKAYARKYIPDRIYKSPMYNPSLKPYKR